MELKDKVVVITGGSKGLGKALADVLTQEGVKVIIGARKKEELEKVASELGVDEFLSDVTKETEVESLAKHVLDKYGEIDIWINNAGVRIPHGPVEELNMERFRGMVEVNLFGLANGSKSAMKAMKSNREGVIINILSTSALDGRPNLSAYAASKFAALGFSKSLRAEAEPEGIRVINVYPGGMRTNFFDEQKPDDYKDYMDPKIVAETVVANLEKNKPEEELIIKRPKK